MKSEAVEELLIDLGQLQLLDVFEGDFDGRFFTLQFFIGVGVGHLDGEFALFAGLHSLEFHVQIVELDSGESAGPGDHLPSCWCTTSLPSTLR